ncbi:MAG: hypothetical protein HYZ29_11705 [Myxococcales bacterium]|nr:hypothetical protein [Myxococcales bacterium]
MSTLAIALLVAALIALALVFVPVRLRFTLQARGEPSGFWALAGGAQIGPMAASGVAAKGVPAHLNLHVFGRRLWQKRLAELAEPKPEAEDDAEALKDSALSRAEAGYHRLERWFDPTDLFLFLVGERRRIVIEPTLIELEYGFRDIALTGKTLGAIYALSPLLPAPVVVRQIPHWESTDRAGLAASGAIRVWPGLLVVDAAWYLIRNVKIRRPKGAARGAPTAP